MRTLGLIVSAFMAAATPAFAQQTGEAPSVPASDAKPKKPAEARAEQLDILFARLHKADAAAAGDIEQKIWALWSTSDSPTAEVLLQESQKAIDGGAPAEALSILNRLIGAYPDFAEAWNKRATLYYLMKKDDASLADIGKVLELEPRHFGAIAGRGMIYQREKKYALALDSFRDALAINPGMDAVRSAIKDIERMEQGI